MYKNIQTVVIAVGVLAIVVFSLQLPTWSERVVMGGGAAIVLTILVVLITERVRRVVEGYYTYMSGGAEDGDLVYKEGNRTLRLYFKRRPHTIFVPTNTKWIEAMPNWAKQDKDRIMKRIKSQVGKHCHNPLISN